MTGDYPCGCAVWQWGPNPPAKCPTHAALYAAAPALLEALKGMIARLESCGSDLPWDGRGGPDPQDLARAAVAKAEGK